MTKKAQRYGGLGKQKSQELKIKLLMWPVVNQNKDEISSKPYLLGEF